MVGGKWRQFYLNSKKKKEKKKEIETAFYPFRLFKCILSLKHFLEMDFKWKLKFQEIIDFTQIYFSL